MVIVQADGITLGTPRTTFRDFVGMNVIFFPGFILFLFNFAVRFFSAPSVSIYSRPVGGLRDQRPTYQTQSD